jgi:hypothetical protein
MPQKKNNKRKTKPRRKPTANGTVNRPPKTRGLVQLGDSISRNSNPVETFRVSFALQVYAGNGTSGTSISLYDPFLVYTNMLSSATYGLAAIVPPASLTNLYATYDFYRPLEISVVFEPLLTSTSIPYPFTASMTFENNITVLPTEANLVDRRNSKRFSPSFPSSCPYTIPPLSSETSTTSTANIILGKGWLGTQSASTEANYGNFQFALSGVYPTNTMYVNVQVAYKIMFCSKTL